MARIGAAGAAGLGIVLLGAGFGLGVVFAPREMPAGETRVPTRDVKAPPAAPASAPLPANPGAAPPSLPAATPAPAEQPADLEAARAALAAISAVPVPEGRGVIRGKVLTEPDGKPLAGVEFSLQPEAPPGLFPRTQRAPDEEPSLESVVADSVRRWRWLRDARKKALSDDEGKVQFEGVMDAGHSLSGKLKGWQISAKGNAWKLKPGAEVEFRASRIVEVAVEVLQPDGTAPRQASIRFAQGNSSTGTGWSPENPTARMLPGVYQVSASAGDEEEWKSDPQTVTLALDAPPPPIRLVLKGRPGLKGKVVMDGYSLEGYVRVRLAKIPADGKASPALLEQDGNQDTTAHSQNGFAYSFRDLAPGRYLVGVCPFQRGKVVGTEEVEVGGDVVARDLRIGALDPEEFLVVRVVGPDGSPVPVQQFLTGYRSTNRSSSGGGGHLRRADGAYLVPHQDVDGKTEDDATWWVEAFTATLGKKRAEYRRSQAQEILIRLEEAGVLEVAVSGLKGSALDGTLQVSLQVQEAPGRTSHFGGSQQRLDGEGRASLAGLQPGDYVVVLSGSGRGSSRAIGRFPVAVRSGKNSISVPLPTLYTVTVSGVEANAWIQKKDDGSWSDSRKADAEGRIVFEGLPEGDWTIRSGGKSQEFHLPGATDIRL